MLHKEICIKLLQKDFSREELEKLDVITLNEFVILTEQWDCVTCYLITSFISTYPEGS